MPNAAEFENECLRLIPTTLEIIRLEQFALARRLISAAGTGVGLDATLLTASQSRRMRAEGRELIISGLTTSFTLGNNPPVSKETFCLVDEGNLVDSRGTRRRFDALYAANPENPPDSRN